MTYLLSKGFSGINCTKFTRKKICMENVCSIETSFLSSWWKRLTINLMKCVKPLPNTFLFGKGSRMCKAFSYFVIVANSSIIRQLQNLNEDHCNTSSLHGPLKIKCKADVVLLTFVLYIFFNTQSIGKHTFSGNTLNSWQLRKVYRTREMEVKVPREVPLLPGIEKRHWILKELCPGFFHE